MFTTNSNRVDTVLDSRSFTENGHTRQFCCRGIVRTRLSRFACIRTIFYFVIFLLLSNTYDARAIEPNYKGVYIRRDWK